MKKYVKWTKSLLEPIVLSSISYAECLRKMNLIAAGGNYKNLQINIDKFNIPISHMKHQAWSHGKKIISFHNLKKPETIKRRLIEERGYFCENCKNSEWMSNKIPLELEHIDGNNRNNSKDNLKLLCCNCHAFTPSWRKRNKRKLI